MNLEQFKADGARVKAMRAILDSEIMREALAALSGPRAPQNMELDLDISPTAANIRLGVILGYARLLRDLEELGTYPKERRQIPTDYAQD